MDVDEDEGDDKVAGSMSRAGKFCAVVTPFSGAVLEAAHGDGEVLLFPLLFQLLWRCARGFQSATDGQTGYKLWDFGNRAARFSGSEGAPVPIPRYTARDTFLRLAAVIDPHYGRV